MLKLHKSPKKGLPTPEWESHPFPVPTYLKLIDTFTQKSMLPACLWPIFKKCKHSHQHIHSTVLSHSTRVQKPTLESMPRGTSDTLVQPRSFSNILGVRTSCWNRLPRLMIIAYMTKAKILVHTSIYIDTSNIYEYLEFSTKMW